MQSENTNVTAIKIATASVVNRIPPGLSLVDRLKFAMRFVNEHREAIFWFTMPNDSFMFRVAIASVYATATEEEVDILEKSLQITTSIDAALRGVPVEFDVLDFQNAIPLIGLWRESQKPVAPSEESV